MKNKKILTSRTRVRFSSIMLYRSSFTENPLTISTICEEFSFILTKKTWNIIYFRPTDEMKYSLFLLKYSNYLVKN